MLQKDFRIENLKAPVKAVNGIYNFEPLTIGALVYFDKKAGEKTELKEINLAIRDLSVVDTSGVIIKNISFTGNMDCKEVRKKDLKIDNVKSPIKAEKGVIYLTPLPWISSARRLKEMPRQTSRKSMLCIKSI